MVPLYERLGYRLYGDGVSMPGGAYRLPLILATFDDEHFKRVSPAFRQATADLPFAFREELCGAARGTPPERPAAPRRHAP
jgi:hypothetical protein